MKRTLIQTAVFILLIGAVAFAPSRLQAQETTNAPAAPKPANPEGRRFNGTITAIDLTKKSFIVGKFEYVVTSKTRIFKGKTPGMLEDAAVGDRAMGSYVHGGEKRMLLKVTFLPPPAAGQSAPAAPPADK
jgi:hypothetical protein